MSQDVDTQHSVMDEILEILRSQALSMSTPSTSSRYLRALESFESSVHPTGSASTSPLMAGDSSILNSQFTILNYSQFSIILNSQFSILNYITDWLISLWLIDTPFSTASLYLDIISSLYSSAVKAGLLPPATVFSRIKADLKTLGQEGWKRGINDEIFNRALRLTRNVSNLVSDDAIAGCLVQWSLTHGLTPLTDIALLKREDLPGADNPQSSIGTAQDKASLDSQLLSLASAKRRYILPLRQSQRTPRQLSLHINKIVNDLFRRARLPIADNPFDTIESLWAYAALRAGIPASQLIRRLGHAPLGLPVLTLCNISPQDPDYSSLDIDSYEGDFSQVGKIFLDNPPRWYAMSLRPGVRFTEVCRRIRLLSDQIPDIQLFYPCEEIARAVGKKIVVRRRPFIHSVVFFRARLTDIGTLFAKIGDIAWCYRRSSRPGSPYADISQRQFELFQQTIARFTPDYEVAPAGELKLRKNDRVKIVGGLFSGIEAGFDSEVTSSTVSSEGTQGSCLRSQSSVLSPASSPRVNSEQDPHTIYRLNIIGDNGIEWRISVDPRLVETPKSTGKPQPSDR